jgi:hypothetical protein
MDKPNLKYQIFDLTTLRFEELIVDILKAEFNYDKAFITDGPKDNGRDILVKKGLEKTAIQVKHKYQIPKGSLRQEIEKYKHLLEFHHKFIFITSAQIDKKYIEDCETEKISIISQNEIIQLLDKHSDIAERYFKIVEKKKKSSKTWLLTSIVGIVISINSSIFTLLIDKTNSEKPLASRIDNIKGLEKDLEEIKDDMIKTDLENKRILEENEKMQGLEELINDKKESLSLVLNYQPWYKKLLNYFLGIVTGIFSSIIASILWNRWRLYKSLKN